MFGVVARRERRAPKNSRSPARCGIRWERPGWWSESSGEGAALGPRLVSGPLADQKPTTVLSLDHRRPHTLTVVTVPAARHRGRPVVACALIFRRSAPQNALLSHAASVTAEAALPAARALDQVGAMVGPLAPLPGCCDHRECLCPRSR